MSSIKKSLERADFKKNVVAFLLDIVFITPSLIGLATYFYIHHISKLIIFAIIGSITAIYFILWKYVLETSPAHFYLRQSPNLLNSTSNKFELPTKVVFSDKSSSLIAPARIKESAPELSLLTTSTQEIVKNLDLNVLLISEPELSKAPPLIKEEILSLAATPAQIVAEEPVPAHITVAEQSPQLELDLNIAAAPELAPVLETHAYAAEPSFIPDENQLPQLEFDLNVAAKIEHMPLLETHAVETTPIPVQAPSLDHITMIPPRPEASIAVALKMEPGVKSIHSKKLSFTFNFKILEAQLFLVRSSAFAIVSLYLIFAGTLLYNKMQSTELPQCGNFNEELKSWNSQIEPKPTKISAALAYFEAGNISSQCLAFQAGLALKESSGIQKSVGLLALQILNPEASISEDVHKSICKIEASSDYCLFASELWSKQNQRRAASVGPQMELQNKIPLKFQSEFYKIRKLKELAAEQKYISINNVLEQSLSMRNFANFYTPIKIKNYWNLNNKIAARANFSAIHQYLPPSEHLQYSSLMCELEISTDCSQVKVPACSSLLQEFEAALPVDRKPFEISFVLATKCALSEKTDFANIISLMQSESSRSYVTALKAVQEKKMTDAKSIVDKLIALNSTDEITELARRLRIEISSHPSELKTIESYVLGPRIPSLQAGYVSLDLMKKLSGQKEFLRANQIALRVIDYFPYNFDNYSIALYLSQRAGDFKSARVISHLRKQREVELTKEKNTF